MNETRILAVLYTFQASTVDYYYIAYREKVNVNKSDTLFTGLNFSSFESSKTYLDLSFFLATTIHVHVDSIRFCLVICNTTLWLFCIQMSYYYYIGIFANSKMAIWKEMKQTHFYECKIFLCTFYFADDFTFSPIIMSVEGSAAEVQYF